MGNYAAQEENKEDDSDYYADNILDDSKESDNDEAEPAHIDTIWTFETNDVQQDEMNKMTIILQEYCKQAISNKQINNKTEDTDKAMVFICALSKKHKMPLVEWLLSTYYREVVDHYCESGDDYDIKRFIEQYPLFRFYNNGTKEFLYNHLTMIIDICHTRLFSKPSLNQIKQSYAICDDINEYIEIVSSFDGFIQNSNQESVLGAWPLYIDLWIIPKNVASKNDMNDNKQIDIGDIKTDLKLCNKLQENDVYQYEIISSSHISWLETFQIIFREACKQFGKDKLEQYKRYVLIIDKRSESVATYFFKAPKGTKVPKKHHQYLTIINFCHSKKLLLPKQDGRDIGAYHRLYNMFCLSYHLKAKNDVSVYWCFNGSQLRFYPSDMLNIWPSFFDSQITAKPNELSQIFRDDRFEKFYESTMKKPLSVLASLKQAKIEQKKEQTLESLCDFIKIQFEEYPDWSSDTDAIIQMIYDEFEDLDQIKEDIEDSEDSNLLTNSNDQQFSLTLANVLKSFIN